MFNILKEEIDWNGQKLTLKTGQVARQADGAVVATLGETTVLATAVFSKEAKPDVDFFPLTINYQEKTYAVGKIPGGYFKRESRPSEEEVLTSRLIDRPIRPLFIDEFRNETQVICTVLSHDLDNHSDILSIIAASAALTLSGAPFLGPVGAARVGFVNDEFVLNPSAHTLQDSKLDLVVSGTKDAVMMVESEAKELTEQQMLDAVSFGHEQMQPVIDMIIRLAEKAAKSPYEVKPKDNADLMKRVEDICLEPLKAAFSETDKQARSEKISAAKALVTQGLADGEFSSVEIADCFKKVSQSIVRNDILQKKTRIDGRDLTTVRPIDCQVSVLPRTHGSALFTRGETQGLLVTTLGTSDDEQMMDSLNGEYRERFLLHYNFPPYSVGEVGRMGSPGRREIGHGKLAWRALNAVLPEKTDFPYTIRLVSEITESNGSSSMATVCGGSLSLMDAGVPLSRPVAGVAMGLILEGSDFAVLTDILGDEDHLGDMDFKVAGTDNGVTALQMDIKVAGITKEIMQQALSQAKDARLHILGEMAKALTEGRSKFSSNVPRIEQIKISPDKIREVIGSGGKVIRSIVEETGAKIDINDDGTIKIASADPEKINAAKDRILGIAAEPEIGQIYTGKVVKIMDFGAFVNFFGSKDGLVHVSQMSFDRNVSPKDIVSEGQSVKVKLIGFDDRGKVKLSMKIVDQETGEEIKQPEDALN
jgi:polyribonucleotide nucleotidyltransferase